MKKKKLKRKKSEKKKAKGCKTTELNGDKS